MFVAILLLLTSCYSNSIYFDLETQSVVRCNGTIKRLYLKSKDDKDDFLFEVCPDKKGSQSFSLKELNKNYSIQVIRNGAHLDLQHFKLRPEMEYEIENLSNGDAAGGGLSIRTDKNGLVVYADKTSCD